MFRIARVLSSSTLVRTTLSTRTYVSGAPADGISVTVCGGGNAAHVAAGMYSRAGAKVNMFFSFEEEARKFREGHSGAITVENFECSTAQKTLESPSNLLMRNTQLQSLAISRTKLRM